MTGGLVPAGVFCLAAGAALGCLFLLCKALRLALGLGPWATALVDVLFCLVCGAWSFLCALAVDQGRLRLFQAVFQGLGPGPPSPGWTPWPPGRPGRQKVFSGEGGRSFGKERSLGWDIPPQGRGRGRKTEKNLEKSRKKRKKRLEKLM